MPLIKDGPPEWIWERPADPLKWEVIERSAHDGQHPVYELRLACGLQILRMHVFNQQEMWSLVDTISSVLPKPTA